MHVIKEIKTLVDENISIIKEIKDIVKEIKDVIKEIKDIIKEIKVLIKEIKDISWRSQGHNSNNEGLLKEIKDMLSHKIVFSHCCLVTSCRVCTK